MGDTNAAIAHVVLGIVASNGMGRYSNSFVHPGMHLNFVVHAIVGCLTSLGKGGDLSQLYKISMAATRHLPIPCLMAENYRRSIASNSNLLKMAHLCSGIIPFALAASGSEDPALGHICTVGNVISLLYYSYRFNNQWGYFTAGATLFAYFVAPDAGKAVYPLGLALMDYCAHRAFWLS